MKPKIAHINFKLIAFLFFIVALWSCEKEELPAAPATIQSQTAQLGDEYRFQEYFNILTNSFVQTNEHFEWDLCFEAGANDKYVYLNSANFIMVKNAGVVSFESVTDTNYSSAWNYDFATGEHSRTAIGKWFNADGTSKNEIYIVNRGKDVIGIDIGFFKLQILSVSKTNFKIRVANLDGTKDRTITINKNPDKRWVQYYFNEDQGKEIEPDSEKWHLLFTQYSDYDLTTTGDTTPYLVRGALLNAENIEATLVDDIDFKDINSSIIPQLQFSSDFNAIGFRWKYFSLNDGVYSIVPGMSYVIKEKNGTYFKLRFLGFYNNDGDKGYPSFEIIGL